MPYLIDHFIPPLYVLNDLLKNGWSNPLFPDGLPDGTVQYDAGMSGGCAWRPFQITQHEYEELVLDLLTSPTLVAQLSVPSETVENIAEWSQRVLAHKNNLTRL